MKQTETQRTSHYIFLTLKIILFITGFVFSAAVLPAQNKIITTRDTIYFSYAIKKNLVPDYQTLLNIISDASYTENEVDAVITNKVKGTRDSRIFTGENAIIEFDLKPGADTIKALRADKNVMDYLKLFFTNYQRSFENTVSLNVLSISPLKRTTFFYCTVLFECEYKNTTVTGESFKKFRRVAEVKFEYDRKWYPVITTISFAKANDPDTLHVYRDITKSAYDPEKLFQLYEDEKEKKYLSSADRINNLILEGDLLFEKEKYDEALSKYLEARKLNYSNKEANASVEKARKIVASKVISQKEGAQKEIHIIAMKKEALRLRDNFNFNAARILCDSLIKDYGENDPEIKKLNTELSMITSCLTGIESAMEHNDLRGAEILCEKNIAIVSNPVYKSELYYRIAIAYDSLDRSQAKKISDNLDRAIELSGRQHKEALKLRALFYMDHEGGIASAITDATQLISNDSRDAENYLFRGRLYEMDKSYTKAIDDYRQALLLNINDTAIYQKKSALEFNMGKYNDAVKTATDGIARTSCYGLLFFNRGISKNRLNDYSGAGDDFRIALSCTPDDKIRTAVRNISENYSNSGTTAFTKGSYETAEKEFTKSILIDSSETALIMRAKCLLYLDQSDSAIADLNALIRKNENFKDVYLQRGITNARLGKVDDAFADFETETKKNRKNARAWYAKGNLELIQKKYSEAATSFEFSATIEPNDSVWYKAGYAYFLNNNFTKAIEAGAKATDINLKLQKAYILCANSFYNKKQYNESVKEFEKAIKAANADDELLFTYSSALESSGDYLKASRNYDLLFKSELYKDTALLRSAICLVKSRSPVNYSAALNKFKRYIFYNSHTDMSEVYAWTAYSYLSLDSVKAADEFIDKAEIANAFNTMLQYVYGCRKAMSRSFDESVNYLERSFTDIELTKSYIETEPLLEEFRKNSTTKVRLTLLIEKYFKVK
ncbi:MAG: tetratricopeptide repeat protein [Bacteroidia bacterium]